MKFGFKSNWRLIHSMYPYEPIISNLSSLSLKDRFDLPAKARVSMFSFQGNSWVQIVSYHLKHFNLKVSIFVVICKIKGI